MEEFSEEGGKGGADGIKPSRRCVCACLFVGGDDSGDCGGEKTEVIRKCIYFPASLQNSLLLRKITPKNGVI